MPCLVDVVDYTQVGSCKDLVRATQENSTNQTTDVLVEDQGLGKSHTGELHQPNNRCFERGSATALLGLSNSFPGVRIP